MRWIKALAALLIIVGIGLVGFSMYITQQIEEGNIKIEKAEKAVKQGSDLFSLTPQTKGIGEQITNSAKKKIDAGKDQIAEYTQLAEQLKMGGIILGLIGIGLFFVGKKKERKK